MGKEPKEKPRCKGRYKFPCPNCDHTGQMAVTKTRVCGKCNGRGCKRCCQGMESYTEWIPCSQCGGLGCVESLTRSEYDQLYPRQEDP